MSAGRRRAPVLAAVAGLGLLLAVQLTLNRAAIEDRLSGEARNALSRAGAGDVQVQVEGRDVVLEAAGVTPGDRDAAVDAVAAVEGVRVVRWAGDPRPDATAPAGGPPSAGPTTGRSGTAEPDPPRATQTTTQTATDPPTTSPTQDPRAVRRKLEADLRRLPQIRFVYNEATLTDDGAATVRRVAALLKQHDGVRIRIEGHTDLDGSIAFNQALSERRAEAVKDALVDEGISGKRLETIGYGELRPVIPRLSPEANVANRRIVFDVLD